MKPYQTVQHQEIPMGPVASQIAIKQLGSNGGFLIRIQLTRLKTLRLSVILKCLPFC